MLGTPCSGGCTCRLLAAAGCSHHPAAQPCTASADAAAASCPPPAAPQALKDGKRLLKEGSAAAAMVRFEKALMLAKVRWLGGGLARGAGAGQWTETRLADAKGTCCCCCCCCSCRCICRSHACSTTYGSNPPCLLRCVPGAPANYCLAVSTGTQCLAAALLLQVTGDRVKERRATRGLAAAARMQGQLRQAVKHLERVLEVRSMGGCFEAGWLAACLPALPACLPCLLAGLAAGSWHMFIRALVWCGAAPSSTWFVTRGLPGRCLFNLVNDSACPCHPVPADLS